MNKYTIKTDDILLKLLNDYHQIDVSEVMSFFGERAKEMLECEPNIVINERHRSVNMATGRNTNPQFLKDNKVYVLRGFYPNTNLPFKMTLVKFHDFPEAKGKVILGLKEDAITKYQEAASEAILLSKDVDEEAKVKYQKRAFKCMRPRGMELYHEKS